MLNSPSHNRLAWVVAALMAVALPGATSAFAAAVPSSQLLSSQLPAGVTLSRASVSQMASALHAAVAKDPERAASLTTAAINAKKKSSGMNCGQLRSLVDAAMSAAPGKSRDIVEAAMAAMPDCSETMTRLLGSTRGNGAAAAATAGALGTVGEAAAADAQGFGAGLGSGFPGSPGFTGSAPSGAFAFPTVPTVPAVTSVLNQ